MADGNFTNIYATGIISAAGNVTGGLLKSSSQISAVGNITGATFKGASVSVTGAIQTAGNIVGARYYGNGAALTGITATNAQTAIVVTGASQPNITSIGTLSSLSVTGSVSARNVSATGNVSAAGNVYANNTITARNITVSNTVTAQSFSGNGSQLTGIVAQSSNVAVAVTGNSQPNITQVGTLNSLSVVGTASAYNFAAGGAIYASGNITGQYILGNGAFLTGVTATATNAISALTVTSSAQPNITSLGTLSTLNVNGLAVVRNLSTAGTVTAGNFVGDGSQLTGVGGVAPGRVTLSASSGLLNPGQSSNININGFKGYALYAIQTSASAWATVYISNATRTADASRPQGVDPAPGSGVVGEVITSGNSTLYFTPAVIGFNADLPISTNIPIKVVNNTSGQTAIIVTLTLVKVES